MLINNFNFTNLVISPILYALKFFIILYDLILNTIIILSYYSIWLFIFTSTIFIISYISIYLIKLLINNNVFKIKQKNN